MTDKTFIEESLGRLDDKFKGIYYGRSDNGSPNYPPEELIENVKSFLRQELENFEKHIRQECLNERDSYSAQHWYVEKLRGKPKKCEICGSTNHSKFDWANVSGKYADPTDYVRLCSSCHRIYDLSRVKPNSKSGVRGVIWDKRYKRWVVRFGRHGKHSYFGSFRNLEEAITRSLEVQKELNADITAKISEIMKKHL